MLRNKGDQLILREVFALLNILNGILHLSLQTETGALMIVQKYISTLPVSPRLAPQMVNPGHCEPRNPIS